MEPQLFDFGWSLRFWMKERGMSQGDIMRATGLERSYISRLATNKVKYPRFETVEKIARALSVSLHDFMSVAIVGGKEQADPGRLEKCVKECLARPDSSGTYSD